MFLTPEDQKITEEYLLKGHVIRPVANKKALDSIRSDIVKLSKKKIGLNSEVESSSWLNSIHEKVPVNELNNFRIDLINGINAESEFRQQFFELARPYLESLVGNELAMQLRISLSIQLPQDDSSLLPIHSDTWSGDSPFEVVVWVPLVDCYGTKTMYLLPSQENKKLTQNLVNHSGKNSETLYQSIAKEVIMLEVRYGEVLIFNQNLPHGNRVNKETETRWSMNCRYKGIFTPYNDKKLGEFFEPITLRASSLNGMSYQYPKTS
jgi:sporadic carbohydrate cluster 2OG-Fe(II) oxygenase